MWHIYTVVIIIFCKNGKKQQYKLLRIAFILFSFSSSMDFVNHTTIMMARAMTLTDMYSISIKRIQQEKGSAKVLVLLWDKHPSIMIIMCICYCYIDYYCYYYLYCNVIKIENGGLSFNYGLFLNNKYIFCITKMMNDNKIEEVFSLFWRIGFSVEFIPLWVVKHFNDVSYVNVCKKICTNSSVIP